MGRVEEVVEVLDGAELGEDVGEVGDVVAAVAQRGGEERRDPQAVDAEPLEVVELLDQPLEVAGAVAVGVAERPDQHLVEDRGLEPVGRAADLVGERVGVRRRRGLDVRRLSVARGRCSTVASSSSAAQVRLGLAIRRCSSRSGRAPARGRGRAGRSCAGPSSSPAPVISSWTANVSPQSSPSAGRSRWTVVSRVACGSRLTTMITVSLCPSGSGGSWRRPGRSRRRCCGSRCCAAAGARGARGGSR